MSSLFTVFPGMFLSLLSRIPPLKSHWAILYRRHAIIALLCEKHLGFVLLTDTFESMLRSGHSPSLFDLVVVPVM
jgi:hypothetical protein